MQRSKHAIVKLQAEYSLKWLITLMCTLRGNKVFNILRKAKYKRPRRVVALLNQTQSNQMETIKEAGKAVSEAVQETGSKIRYLLLF
jgi:hypothetical protein